MFLLSDLSTTFGFISIQRYLVDIETYLDFFNSTSNLFNVVIWIRSCLYEKNHPTQVRYFTWVRSRQNGVFHFGKANHLYENGFIRPSWDFTSTNVRSHLDEMIFLHVNSFCQAVPPREDCLFSLDSACFYIYCLKNCNSSHKI